MSNDAFLQAMAENPDDDAVRLVYSDWLEEHGERERAEFVRTQVELTSLSVKDARYPELARRELELIEEHGMAWARAEVPAEFELDVWGDEASGFRRGMPAVLTCKLAHFLSGGEGLARVPVERLRIQFAGADELHDLAACPALRHVHGLRLNINAKQLQTLFASPHLGMLQRLFLLGSLSKRSVDLLGGSQRLGRLDTLDIHGCELTNAGLASVLRPEFRSVRHVSLGQNKFDDAGARLLAESDNPRSWESLNLSYTTVGLDGLLALVESGVFDGLKTLDVTHFRTSSGEWWFGNTLVEYLVRGGWPKNLRGLTLDSNDLSPTALSMLAGHKAVGRMTSLSLSGNAMEGEGVRALAGSPHLVGLEGLSLAQCELDDADAALLAASVYLAPYRLSLAGNLLRAAGMRDLCRGRLLANVVRLDLMRNRMEDDGLAALAEAQFLPRLSELRLNHNRIGDRGIEALAASPGLAGIVRLDLAGNRIGDQGAIALAKAPYAGRLRHVSVAGNVDVSKRGYDALRERFGARAVVR